MGKKKSKKTEEEGEEGEEEVEMTEKKEEKSKKKSKKKTEEAAGDGEDGKGGEAEEKKSKKKSKKKDNADDDAPKKPKSSKKSGKKGKKSEKDKAAAEEEPVTRSSGSAGAGADDKKDMVLKASGWECFDMHKAPDAKFAITGNESQVVSVALNPGDTLKGEPGTMMFLTPGVKQNATCEGCCSRMLAGEDCCVLNFTNKGSSGIGYAALTPNEPLGKVIPIDLSSPDVGGTLIAQQGTYMASYGDVEVGVSFDCKCCRCCCGGVGLVRQKITGSGTVFLGATGTIVVKKLLPEEVMIMDTNSILAFSESCKLDIKRAGGMLGMLGGGEGIFNTTLEGPGLAVVQSMNKQVFLDSLAANKIYRR
jgi:uncharacterized protein (AIM24 family)